MIETAHAAYMWTVQFCWRSLPFAVTLVLMLVSGIPLHLFHDAVPVPSIALASLFFWAINGPGFMPPWAVFLTGVAQDLLSGTPLGFWVVVYLATYGFTLTQRVFFRGRTGIGAWLGFALVAGFATVSAWLLAMVLFERWLAPGELVMQGLVTLALYPLFARIFALLRRVLTTVPEGV
jgi:rod shape-determining protein MreD